MYLQFVAKLLIIINILLLNIVKLLYFLCLAILNLLFKFRQVERYQTSYFILIHLYRISHTKLRAASLLAPNRICGSEWGKYTGTRYIHKVIIPYP